MRAMTEPVLGDFCIICGEPPAVIGIFVPDDAQKYGAPEKKMRFIRYCLCELCMNSEDVKTQVEKILLSEVSGGGYA